jgi:hypothetical protein
MEFLRYIPRKYYASDRGSGERWTPENVARAKRNSRAEGDAIYRKVVSKEPEKETDIRVTRKEFPEEQPFDEERGVDG